MKTVFRNAEEFLAEVAEVEGIARAVRARALREGNQEMLAHADKLLTLFANNGELLRKGLEKLQGPDGRIRFGLSGDALRLLRKTAGGDS